MSTGSIVKMQDIDLKQKTVLIREDLNVPIKDGVITSDARLKAALPTIRDALTQEAAVIIASHLGRPSEGEFEPKYSLAPVAQYLSAALDTPVRFVDDYLENPVSLAAGEIVLLENVRFNQGEKSNDPSLSEQYARLADVFVMDAFGTAHRAQASTEGVIRAMRASGKPVCAGNLLAAELDALAKVVHDPIAPVVAIVGGSKVSTKLDVLESLANLCQGIIVGGGIANTFLVASGVKVGTSLYEPDLVDTAKQIMKKTTVYLPSTVVVADKTEVDFDDFLASLERATAIIKPVGEIGDDEMILDVYASDFQAVIADAKTILWNGPLGVFEVHQFGEGTKLLAHAIKDSLGFSVAGGGDTLAAIDKYGVADGIDYISTGGGAFLEFVEGKTLPAIAALKA